MYAQNNGASAHMRSYNFSLGAIVDVRMPALLLKPEVDLRFLEGKLQFKGFIAKELTPFIKLQEKFRPGTIALKGDNLSRKHQSHEAQVGFNFFKHFNPDATVSRSSSSTRFTFITFGPGSRFIQLGTHAGLGGFVSKTEFNDKYLNFTDDSGNVLDFKSQLNTGGNSKFEVYTNTITNYLFLGMHANTGKKFDMHSNKPGGGMNTSYALDLIVPTNVWIGDVYDIVDKRYVITPKPNEKLKKLGFRFVVEKATTYSVWANSKFEFGYMNNLALDLEETHNFYCALGISIAISPRVGFIEFN